MARAQHQVAVISRSDPRNGEERGELVVSSPDSPDRFVGACQAGIAYYNGFPEARGPAFSASSAVHVANDNRSLPQSAQSLVGRKHGADEGPDACVGRHRASFQSPSRGAGVWVRNSAFSASSSASSAVMVRRSSRHGRVSPSRRTGGRSRAPTVLVGGHEAL
jgi:hypothetical protein